MNIEVNNLGKIRKAEFELGDLTVICGTNNTGKTYATYALYGFLSHWRAEIEIPVSGDILKTLLSEGTVQVNLTDYTKKLSEIIKKGCDRYSKNLSFVLAGNEKLFETSNFQITVPNSAINLTPSYNRIIGASETKLFSFHKEADSSILQISLLIDQTGVRIPDHVITEAISRVLEDIILGHIFPTPFIASAERTGAAIFRKELNLSRNRLLEEISNTNKEIDPIEILTKSFSDYALPVKSNIEFTRQLETISKKESFIAKEHPEIINSFSDIIGGEYIVNQKDELYFSPRGTKHKLTMGESSSAVRSLLDIGFYLRHQASKDDLLMIDEPELNLHPENQRRIARLFAQLVNIGIKVYITTHSDYIIKEFNTLIMLNQDLSHVATIAEKEGYKQSELLDHTKVKVYIAQEELVKLAENSKKTKCHTLASATITAEEGIAVKSFDNTIEEMNRIQDEIIWGE